MRNGKEAQSYLLHQWTFWSVAFIMNLSVPCVSILHIRALAQGNRYSNVNVSFLPQSTLLAEATVNHWLVIPLLNKPSGSQYFHKSFSLSPLAL
jgi:hypothetical protein